MSTNRERAGTATCDFQPVPFNIRDTPLTSRTPLEKPVSIATCNSNRAATPTSVVKYHHLSDGFIFASRRRIVKRIHHVFADSSNCHRAEHPKVPEIQRTPTVQAPAKPKSSMAPGDCHTCHSFRCPGNSRSPVHSASLRPRSLSVREFAQKTETPLTDSVLSVSAW